MSRIKSFFLIFGIFIMIGLLMSFAHDRGYSEGYLEREGDLPVYHELLFKARTLQDLKKGDAVSIIEGVENIPFVFRTYGSHKPYAISKGDYSKGDYGYFLQEQIRKFSKSNILANNYNITGCDEDSTEGILCWDEESIEFKEPSLNSEKGIVE